MALTDLWQLITKPAPPPARPRLLPPARGGAMVLPALWDEQEIGEQMRTLPGRSPAMMAYYLNCLKDRFLLHQDRRTAAVRARFLTQKLEELKLTRELQGVINDLAVLSVEREVRVRRLELEKLELVSKIQNQTQLGALRLQRDRLQLQYEIATLRRQIREQKRLPAAAENKLTPAQQRVLKKAEIEEQIQRLRAEEAQALQKATSELERRRIQNMYAAKRDQLMEQMEKYL